MKRRSTVLSIIACLLCLAIVPACSDDEAPAVAYRQDLADMRTGSDGVIRSLVLDDGMEIPVTNGHLRAPMTPDTAYRVQVLYVLQAEGAELYNLTSVFSPWPITMSADDVCRDPLSLDALWRGGNYVNFLVSFKTGGQTHAVAFVDHGVTTQSDGTRWLHLELYHDRKADPAYYTQQVYLSCPLQGYAGALTAGRDSVAVSVNTAAGQVVRHLPF